MEQNISPQSLLLWHVACFELKAIKMQQTQGKLYLSPNCLKEFRLEGLYQEETYYQR